MGHCSHQTNFYLLVLCTVKLTTPNVRGASNEVLKRISVWAFWGFQDKVIQKQTQTNWATVGCISLNLLHVHFLRIWIMSTFSETSKQWGRETEMFITTSFSHPGWFSYSTVINSYQEKPQESKGLKKSRSSFFLFPISSYFPFSKNSTCTKMTTKRLPGQKNNKTDNNNTMPPHLWCLASE